MVLVKLCLRIDSHHLVFEVVLGVGELRAELGKFAGITEHLLVLIGVAIVHLMLLSLWVDESHNGGRSFPKGFRCSTELLTLDGRINRRLWVVALALPDSILNSGILLCMNSRVSLDSGIFPVNEIGGIDVDLLANNTFKLVLKDSA